MSSLFPAGAAANVGGNLLNAYGQTQGGAAASGERRRQLMEQDAIQEEANRNAQNELATYNPVLQQRAAQDALNAPGQAAIAQTAAAQPKGGDIGNAGAAQMAGADVSAGASQRAALVAQATAPQEAEQGINNRLSRFSDTNSTLENKAGRLAKLYDMRVNTSANAGGEYRAAGKMLSSAGSMGMGASGMMGG